MSNFVPSDVPVRRNRAHNVDSDRLLRRRDFLHDLLFVRRGRDLDQRFDMVVRSAEMCSVEDVLVDRGDLDPQDRHSHPPHVRRQRVVVSLDHLR
jgi:hypothetical protein